MATKNTSTPKKHTLPTAGAMLEIFKCDEGKWTLSELARLLPIWGDVYDGDYGSDEGGGF